MIIQQPRRQLQSEILEKKTTNTMKRKKNVTLKINRLLFGRFCFIPER
jgi:hypothetical protein